MDHENYCSHCKWGVREGGDWVPYGSSGARLPEYLICECPYGEEMDDACEATNDGKDCEFFE